MGDEAALRAGPCPIVSRRFGACRRPTGPTRLFGPARPGICMYMAVHTAQYLCQAGVPARLRVVVRACLRVRIYLRWLRTMYYSSYELCVCVYIYIYIYVYMYICDG